MIYIAYADVSPLDDDSLFARYYSSVSQYRKKKIDGFRFRKDKNLSLGAGIILNCLLEQLNFRETEMEYDVKENDKPYFKNVPKLHFNISHSGQYTAAAVSDYEIGCDIEKTDVCNMAVAKRFFSENEYNFLCKSENKNEDFYRLWTLKESYMKVTGLGMRLPLNSFCIDLSQKKITVTHNKSDGNYYFGEYSGIEGYCFSYCCKNSPEKPEIKQIKL